jgi:hypothetical protein
VDASRQRHANKRVLNGGKENVMWRGARAMAMLIITQMEEYEWMGRIKKVGY